MNLIETQMQLEHFKTVINNQEKCMKDLLNVINQQEKCIIELTQLNELRQNFNDNIELKNIIIE